MPFAAQNNPELQIVRLGFAKRTFQACLALMAVAALVSIAGKELGRSMVLAGHTDSRTLFTVRVGEDSIGARANAIRFESARRNGPAERLELYLRWPTLQGYTPETRDDFNNRGGSRNILFLTFEQRSMSRDMSGRYGPIYQSLIEPVGVPGPAGLRWRAFTKASGYENESLAVAGDPESGLFVARCLTGPSAAESLASCERDIQIGEDLSLRYRFPEKLLAQWLELDQAVRRTAESMLEAGRKPPQRSTSSTAIEKLYDSSPSSSSLKMMPRNSSPT